MPQIGEITPGLWLLSGFGTRGLNTTAMGGEIVARAIVEGDRTWQIFSPFALVWSGGVPGRVAQQVSYWSTRAKELFVSRRAQRREERRQREAEDNAPAVAAVESSPASAPPEPVALESAPAGPASEPAPASGQPAASSEGVAAPAENSPPIAAAQDVPEILLQPASAAKAPARPKRAKPKKKREADPAGEGPTGGTQA